MDIVNRLTKNWFVVLCVIGLHVASAFALDPVKDFSGSLYDSSVGEGDDAYNVVGFSFGGGDVGLVTSGSRCGLFTQIPAIGVYYGDGYNFRNRKFILRMLPTMLQFAPQALNKAIPEGAVVDFYSVVTGMVDNKARDSASRTYNLVYHGFLSINHPNVTDFNENVVMGIYNPINVGGAQGSPIALEALTPQDVNFHGGNYCSPNNAQFKVSNDCKIATFWSLAILPGNGRAVVTYHLIIQNSALEAQFVDIFNEQNDFNIILSKLESLVEAQNPMDQISLSEFIAKIREMKNV